jgi:type I restriction enzyme S subunit
MADPGKIGICESSIDAIFASYLIRLKIIKEITPYYLFYYLNSEKYQGYIQGNSNGTTRKSINAQQVVNTKILIPSKEILNRFEFKVSQYRELLIKILDINSMLKDTKDYLIRDFF